MRVVIIGGGISGLTTAFLARAAGHEVTCLEPAVEPGGLMRSERHEGFLCEFGPQAVLSDAPDTTRLLAALGLASRILHAERAARRRFIFAHDRLWPVPLSPPALLRSGLLSFSGKARLLAEPLISRQRRPETDDAESVAEFGDRRLGREASRVLLATAAIGIYAGEASGLSLASAFPRLAALEQEHGGLFRGMLASRKASRNSGTKAGRSPAQSISLPEGLGELVAALAQSLGGAVVRARAVEVRPSGPGTGTWQVVAESVARGAAKRQNDGPDDGVPPPGRTFEAEHVVVAANAEATTQLLRPLFAAASSTDRAAPSADEALAVLTANRRAPVAIACLGFRDASGESLGMELDAYGFLVARGERARMLGCQYESSIFPGRAPAGAVLLRAILGGTGAGFEPEIVDQSDEAIAAHALEDLRRVAGLKRDPDLVRVWRHREGIPQYAAGHAARRAALDGALARLPGLHVIGYSVRGVAVNDCIHAASELALRLTAPPG